jgi:hypothetical protein
MWLARSAAVVSGSDWRPQRGDVLHAVDSASPVFHFEHAFTPEEIEAEARDAGLSVRHHESTSNNPVLVLSVRDVE